ncbi:SIS domain-containing protein [Paenibacillus sp. RC67]|uniref:D-sedoheptulose-7-phosphate isomerase n=1 Tax=Paenibacillus sp. RC67 TaxID=3039392 RepID=UPI0024ACC49B|nr:SIS domain-containing protein [Paenibacillus sp. RC67]
MYNPKPTRTALHRLIAKYPEVAGCQQEIEKAIELIAQSYQQGGKLLVCGNGGSASDSEHIVGELMKGFMSRRPLSGAQREGFLTAFPNEGSYLADHLQGALPAISLVSQSAFLSAYANDVAPDMAFAQQVYGYAKPGDVLLGISTSGHSANVLRAVQVARALGVSTIGLTGQTGGKLAELSDVAICVPYHATPDIQERHLPIYHAICIALEEQFFGT